MTINVSAGMTVALTIICVVFPAIIALTTTALIGHKKIGIVGASIGMAIWLLIIASALGFIVNLPWGEIDWSTSHITLSETLASIATIVALVLNAIAVFAMCETFNDTFLC